MIPIDRERGEGYRASGFLAHSRRLHRLRVARNDKGWGKRSYIAALKRCANQNHCKVELRSLTSFVLLMRAWRRISACCLAVAQSCFSTASVNPGNSR